jgi:uncharacterized protein
MDRHLEIRRDKVKGRCVYALYPFCKGDLIECCEVILLPHSEACGALAGFTFQWSEKKSALALGFGSLYSHSYQPNARYWMLYGKRPCIEIRALRDIATGEEITFNYNADPKDKSPLWFTPV